MSDEFSNYEIAPDGPAGRSQPIVPHDINEIEPTPRAVHVGTAGTMVGRLLDDGQDRTFKVAAGLCPYRFKLIKATGTTAGDLLALY